MQNPVTPRLIIAAASMTLVVFFFGAFVGWFAKDFAGSRLRAEEKETPEKREGQSGLVNPLLECEGGEVLARELTPFKERILERVEKHTSQGRASSVAVYFRDLNNGPWFGIGEKEMFVPGSLLKIPLMIAYLKIAESDPKVLTTPVKFTGKLLSSGQFIKPSSEIRPDKSYTVDELINAMIVHSDNNAAYILNQSDVWNYKVKVYSDFGIPPPGRSDPYEITVKRYASFFRILFNSAYLGKEMSNHALTLLTQSQFKDGIVAGVPEGVPVAHKFGERVIGDKKQFHDCGIVYYPRQPYLLCVMTRGESFPDLIGVISDISRLTYEEVDRQVREGAGG